MTPAKIKAILTAHKNWRADPVTGKRAYLDGADLDGADLRRADLDGADLRGADLDGADLRGANLRGAYLGSSTIIDAGSDSRGYRFVANVTKDAVMINAGCRQFTLPDAWTHWKERHDPPLREEIHAKLTLIETVAKARGWPLKSN